ncbi:MAG: LysR family transcriptional regulator [Isosphaeraceae bacterium]|nr:LysR family transcriptional regulator [Isosphaeraceae bacterium]
MAARRRQSYKEPSLSQFRTFCVVCRRGGYAAAAREVLLTSPAVWEQMQSLESYYGVRLLERFGAGVRPTVHGRRLLEMVQPLLTALESTREVLKQEDGAPPRELRLVTNLRVLVEEVSEALRAFQLRFPAIQLRVDYTGIDVIEPRVVSGEADVAFTLEPGPGSRPSGDTLYEPAGELDYLLVTPPGHALTRSRPLQLDEVVRYPLVLAEPGAYSRHRVQEVFHRFHVGELAQIAVETSSDEYTLACVRAGLGVGITLGLPRGRLYRGLAVRSLSDWFGRARVGFLWKRGVFVPPVSRALADQIGASFRVVAPGQASREE